MKLGGMNLTWIYSLFLQQQQKAWKEEYKPGHEETGDDIYERREEAAVSALAEKLRQSVKRRHIVVVG